MQGRESRKECHWSKQSQKAKLQSSAQFRAAIDVISFIQTIIVIVRVVGETKQVTYNDTEKTYGGWKIV